MLRYLLRRLLVFIPSLFAVTLVAFILLSYMPGDPVDAWMGGSAKALRSETEALRQQREKVREQLGLNLPIFYLSFRTLAEPDTFYRISNPDEQQALGLWIEETGNWPLIQEYYRSVSAVNDLLRSPGLAHPGTGKPRVDLLHLRESQEDWKTQCHGIRTELQDQRSKTDLFTRLEEAEALRDRLATETSTWKTWIPSISFHGNNRYHRWVFGDGNWLTGAGSTYTKGIIRGDFGLSYRTRQPVSERIGQNVFWSVLFTVLSVVLAFAVSLPMGAWAAARPQGWFDRVSGILVFLLYAMPPFWVAVLLLMTFSNPDLFDWFPVAFYDGSLQPKDAGWGARFSAALPHLVLPLVAYTYSSFAFLSRTVRVSMLETLGMDFVRTARAKGLAEKQVVFRHGLRNALLPVITVLANVFPAAIGGAVLLESIFGIPGMGLEIFNAVDARDFPVIIAVFTLAGILTMIGYLVADIGYALVDPRIRLNRKA